MAVDPQDTLTASLANREHSRVELDRKLQSRHPALSQSERKVLLDRLIELNLQSDERFAEMLIRLVCSEVRAVAESNKNLVHI